MLKIIAALAAALAVSAAAADDGWFLATESSSAVFSLKKGSGQFTRNRDQERIYVATMRTTSKITRRIELNRVYVVVEDCAKGSGLIVTLGIDGGYQYSNDWVTGAGTVASLIAETLCNAQQIGTGKSVGAMT